jgi:hypothetical protein
LAVLPLLAAAGCLQTPANGASVANIDDQIAFSGLVKTAGASVSVRAASSRGGSPTVVATTPAGTTAVPNFHAYPWSVGSQISEPLWGNEGDVDGDGCHLRVTYVTAESLGTPLVVSNADASDPSHARVLGYPPLVAPEHGLTISTQADADGLRCARVILGNLTIADSTDHAISLPNLERVSGNLTVSYPSRNITDSTNTSCEESRQFRAPSLLEVDGDVDLEVVTTHDFQNVDVGLPALATVGGSLTVNTTGRPDIAVAGLDVLASVPGKVTVAFAHDTGCYISGSLEGIDGACVAAPVRPPLLDALASAGAADVTTPIESFCILNHLTHVDHDLVIRSHLPGVNFLSALHDVGGDLRFETGTQGGFWTPPLASAGRIVVTSSTISIWPLRLGSGGSPPSVRAVDIEGSSISSLSGASLTLQPATAPVTILNDTSLPHLEICSFLTAISAMNVTLDSGVACP